MEGFAMKRLQRAINDGQRTPLDVGIELARLFVRLEVAVAVANDNEQPDHEDDDSPLGSEP